MARAQELTQETFIRAYRTLAQGERWDNPRAWLYRVASRLAMNEHRRRKLIEWLPLSGIEADSAPEVEAIVIEDISVRAALSALPLKYRIPLVLCICEGWKVAEVADALGLTANGVKARLKRARAKFRRAYLLGTRQR